jgi:hypothetical protein
MDRGRRIALYWTVTNLNANIDPKKVTGYGPVGKMRQPM